MNRRHVGLALVVIVSVASVAMLVPVLGNHLLAGDTEEIGVTVAEASVTESDGDTVVVATLRIDNPTTRPLVVPETVGYNELGVKIDGEDINRRRRTDIERGRVPAGGTGTATFRFPTKDRYADRVEELLADARLSGQVPFALDGRTVEVEIGVPMTGGDA